MKRWAQYRDGHAATLLGGGFQVVKALLLALILALASAAPSAAQPEPIGGGGGSGSGAGGPLVITTAGPVSLTGPTVETNITALKIPGGSMGPNGFVRLECLWTYTNSSNNKTMTLRYGPTAGQVSGGVTGTALVATTTAGAQTLYIMRNNNSVSSQTFWQPASTTPYGVAAPTPGVLSINTAADSYLNINGTLAVGTETITVQHCAAIVYKAN